MIKRTALRLLSIVAVTGTFLLAMAIAVNATPKAPAVYTGIIKGTAVGGYDPVAYFTQGKAVRGDAAISLEYDGAIWRFASAENRDLFKVTPTAYGPQYGGHCAWAVASGYTAKGDPDAWSIVNGRLFLNYNKAVQRSWEAGAQANIVKGDGNWSRMRVAP